MFELNATPEGKQLAASFIDTSALAKLYHAEAGTQFMEELLLRTDAVAFISRLGILEMHSVLAGKVRTRQSDSVDESTVRKRFRGDIRKRRFQVVRVSVGHFQRVERLIETYGGSMGLRTLDALQLSMALDLNADHLIDTVVAADRILCDVAKREGMVVIDPENAML